MKINVLRFPAKADGDLTLLPSFQNQYFRKEKNEGKSSHFV